MPTPPDSYYFDEKGFVGHRDEKFELEFGDGMQRLSFFYFGLWLDALSEDGADQIYADYKKREYLIWPPFSEPRRHWDAEHWWGQLGYGSADQMEPTICFDLAVGNYISAQVKLSQLSRRFFFCWNTKRIWETDGWKIPDWAGLRFLGYWLRAYEWKWLTWFWDLTLIPSVLFKILIGFFDKNNTSNDLTMCARLACYGLCQPTVWSELSRKFYYHLRPKSSHPGTYSYDYCNDGPSSSVCWYFEAPPENRAPLFLGKIWQRAIENHF